MLRWATFTCFTHVYFLDEGCWQRQELINHRLSFAFRGRTGAGWQEVALRLLSSEAPALSEPLGCPSASALRGSPGPGRHPQHHSAASLCSIAPQHPSAASLLSIPPHLRLDRHRSSHATWENSFTGSSSIHLLKLFFQITGDTECCQMSVNYI